MAIVEEMHPLHFSGWNRDHLVYPYAEVFHARQLVDEIYDQLDEPIYRTDIEEVFQYILGSTKSIYKEIDTLFANGQVNGRHLDKLFAPGELVVCRDDGQPVAMTITQRYIAPKIVTLTCRNWRFDGRFHAGQVKRTVKWIGAIDDEISITSLETFPLRLGGNELSTRLYERGKVFWDCRRRNFVNYHAPFQRTDIATAPPRYMIDHDMYHQLHDKSSTSSSSTTFDLDDQAFNADEPPSGPFLYMLPTTIIGFQMEYKKWKTLLVQHIEPVPWNTKAFDHLVLEPNQKEFVQALVTHHLSTSQAIQTTDIIDDKGRGLTMLFHGGPGTGKTLTAESIADLAKKPLYRVTCGDIGTEVDGVEKYLEAVLRIGTLWDCVVLLDEADVFLEARTQTDLQRNALVSVFLRVLEYYHGILILTTNRIGTFDKAFKSRIQLPLHYPNLDFQARKRIWHDFISRLPSKLPDLERASLHGKVDLLAAAELNGRQIRNTVRNAEQLAQHRREILAYLHFEKALKVANKFEEYLQKTHGHTDDEFARQEQLRH